MSQRGAFEKVREFTTDEIDSGFGSSLAVSSKRLAVGAPLFDLGRGQVYEFSRSSKKIKWIHEGSVFHAKYGNTIALYDGSCYIGTAFKDICCTGPYIVSLDRINFNRAENGWVSIGEGFLVQGGLVAVSKYFCAVWDETVRHVKVYGYILGKWRTKPLWDKKMTERPVHLAINEKYLFIASESKVMLFENTKDKVWDYYKTIDIGEYIYCMSANPSHLSIGTATRAIVIPCNSFEPHSISVHSPCRAILTDGNMLYVGMPDARDGWGAVHEYVWVEQNVLRDALSRI